eukprot:m.342267 g.342267  ORF g.342267 m.342267 type:complete len:90 (-) comp27848_c2_seq4:2457-2726(-)
MVVDRGRLPQHSSGPLSGWDLISHSVALRALRACLTAWAVSSYLKASMLTRRSRSTSLFRSPMTRSVRQILALYHISVSTFPRVAAVLR